MKKILLMMCVCLLVSPLQAQQSKKSSAKQASRVKASGNATTRTSERLEKMKRDNAEQQAQRDAAKAERDAAIEQSIVDALADFRLGKISIGDHKKEYRVKGSGKYYVYYYKLGRKTVKLREELTGPNPLREKEAQRTFENLVNQLERINDDYVPPMLDLILTNYSLRNISVVSPISSAEKNVTIRTGKGEIIDGSKLSLKMKISFLGKTSKNVAIELLVPSKGDRRKRQILGTLGQGAGVVLAAVGAGLSEAAIGIPICAAGVCTFEESSNAKVPVFYGATLKEIK